MPKTFEIRADYDKETIVVYQAYSIQQKGFQCLRVSL